ncbi:MAG: hypothetical protein U1D29_05500 [Burkholderiales bacterium]|nr:hypothetical protein [Burkholderiales bacterium]
MARMIGVIFQLALHDSTPSPPPIEVYWAYLVNARRGALEALARAKAQHNPATSQAELATLQATVNDYEARLKQLEPLRPQLSVGEVAPLVCQFLL